MVPGVLGIGIAFLASLVGGVLVTSAAVNFGRRAGLVVKPRLFGKSDSPITFLGGPALAASTIGTYLVLGRPPEIVRVLLIAGVAVLVLGLADDLLAARNGIHPLGRLGVEALVAAAAWSQGLSAYSTAPKWLDVVITVVFLVGGMNAFNLIDNMDGVAGVTATAVAIGVTLLAVAGNKPQFALLAACIAGASVAFLCFNLKRPKAYLGDAGSLFLGLILSGMALNIDAGFKPPGNFIAAVVIFAVPFTDTATRQLSRWIAGGSPFDILGSTDHLSHRLVAWGFRPEEAAYLHGIAGLFAAAAAGTAALYLSVVPMVVALVAFAAFGLSFVWSARRRPEEVTLDEAAIGRLVEEMSTSA